MLGYEMGVMGELLKRPFLFFIPTFLLHFFLGAMLNSWGVSKGRQLLVTINR